MKKLTISDMTLKVAAGAYDLSFKEKIEIAKLLDKLNVSVIELAAASGSKVDDVLIRTISSCVKNSAVSIPVALSENGANEAYELIKNAKKARLQVSVPMSTVQMEYICHKKPAAVLEMITDVVSKSKSVCNDVDFVALDATRSDADFLRKAINAAIDAGASTVTLCDNAGEMTTDEFIDFISGIKNDIPSLANVKLAINASNELGMAVSTVLAAVKMGVDEIKTACCKSEVPSLEAILKILRSRGDSIGVGVDVSLTEFGRASRQIEWICEGKTGGAVGTDAQDNEESYTLNEYTDINTVSDTVVSLGYDLSEEDMKNVYEEFKRAASKKIISLRELDAIVASTAMQVPATYKLVSYVINSGNVISSTANILLEKDGKSLAGVCIGDGPIDAAFLAIEQILGHHYELDDFRIQSVTEGREAIGNAVVKLKADGKVYSGNGLSTDIIGASIRAYISAVNKIVFEQNV
ncbi:MAG: hypothetical protein IJW06_03835 [Clostridia bacterium]|nr:hypothetical protein [Clostridia bacterium]